MCLGVFLERWPVAQANETVEHTALADSLGWRAVSDFLAIGATLMSMAVSIGARNHCLARGNVLAPRPGVVFLLFFFVFFLFSSALLSTRLFEWRRFGRKTRR